MISNAPSSFPKRIFTANILRDERCRYHALLSAGLTIVYLILYRMTWSKTKAGAGLIEGHYVDGLRFARSSFRPFGRASRKVTRSNQGSLERLTDRVEDVKVNILCSIRRQDHLDVVVKLRAQALQFAASSVLIHTILLVLFILLLIVFFE